MLRRPRKLLNQVFSELYRPSLKNNVNSIRTHKSTLITPSVKRKNDSLSSSSESTTEHINELGLKDLSTTSPDDFLKQIHNVETMSQYNTKLDHLTNSYNIQPPVESTIPSNGPPSTQDFPLKKHSFSNLKVNLSLISTPRFQESLDDGRFAAILVFLFTTSVLIFVLSKPSRLPITSIENAITVLSFGNVVKKVKQMTHFKSSSMFVMSETKNADNLEAFFHAFVLRLGSDPMDKKRFYLNVINTIIEGKVKCEDINLLYSNFQTFMHECCLENGRSLVIPSELNHLPLKEANDALMLEERVAIYRQYLHILVLCRNSLSKIAQESSIVNFPLDYDPVDKIEQFELVNLQLPIKKGGNLDMDIVVALNKLNGPKGIEGYEAKVKDVETELEKYQDKTYSGPYNPNVGSSVYLHPYHLPIALKKHNHQFKSLPDDATHLESHYNRDNIIIGNIRYNDTSKY